MRLIKPALLIAFLCALLMSAPVSLGYGHELLEVFTNAAGTRCCRVDATSAGPPDCAVIPEGVAMSAGIGTTIIVPLPSGNVPTVIDAIHPSPTEKDYACTPGCLIRRTLY